MQLFTLETRILEVIELHDNPIGRI